MGHKDVKGKFRELTPKEQELALRELGLDYKSNPTGSDLQNLEKKGFFARVREKFNKSKDNQDNFNLPSL